MMSHRATSLCIRRFKSVRRTRFLDFVSSRKHSVITSLQKNEGNGNHRKNYSQYRSFSNKRGGGVDIDESASVLDESDFMEDVQNLKTAEDMDFYDALADNYEDDYFPSNKSSMEECELGEIEESKRQAIRDEIDSRSGRLWQDRWALTDDDWSSGKSFDDLPDWTEEICSRVSRERVKIFPGGVPTLEQLADLGKELPSPQPPHPALGDPKPYVRHRKDAIYDVIYGAVEKFAGPKMERILSMSDWDEKQKAIDELFDEVHDAVKNSDKSDDYVSVVLGSQPTFPNVVERALEEYLRKVSRDEKNAFDEKNDNDNNKEPNLSEMAAPVFMDLMKASGSGSKLDEAGIPKLLYPLKSHPHDGPGRMVEEWELSANQNTKRIMGRQCMSDIARVLNESSKEDSKHGSRVFVTGRKGAGKSAALAAVVASARLSGHIVLYLPDGDRLAKHGFYVEPNYHRKVAADGEGGNVYDLPLLSKEVCSQLHESHSNDMEGMVVTKDTLEKSMSSDQLKKFAKNVEATSDDGSVALNDLLNVGKESTGLAAACYSAAVDTLMAQTSTPFTVVIDQYNCIYDRGHYFHADYDPTVKQAIPVHKITLFQPLVNSIGVEKSEDGQFTIAKEPKLMKRGGIITGITESHAVARNFTAGLTNAVIEAGVNVVDVPQYSPLEVEHILSNFEIIGVGRLRFDRGETVMNKQEVAYLRMVSGGVGQPLLDACLH